MTLFKREPRSVYRVYAEEEYLDGERPPLELDGQPSASAAETPLMTQDRRSAGALLAIGLIAAVALIVMVLVFTAGGHSPRRRSPSTTPVQSAEEKIYRPVWSRPRPPRRHIPLQRYRWPRPPLQRTVSTVPRPVRVVVASSPEPRPDPQLEFGFER